MPRKVWWKFGVFRGVGLPAELDGLWVEVGEQTGDFLKADLDADNSVNLYATNQWEQRDDGEVAVVYRWFNQRAAIPINQGVPESKDV